MSITITATSVYEMDTDQNGEIALTRKNVDFINGILKIDSSYRDSWNPEVETSSAYTITKKFYVNGKFHMDKSIVEELVRRIDQENSTHLAASGNKKGDNQGIKRTVDKICELKDFDSRLRNSDFGLVNEIASAVPNRKNISFATKFCAFVSQFAFAGSKEDDGYCIYDKFIGKVLPYYAWFYTGEKYLNRNHNSNFEKIVKGENGYSDYCRIVERILDESAKVTGYRISKADFDKLIWYCYKGRESRIQKALDNVNK